ncbi:MAG: hypothetical protein ACM3UZ_07160 [Acidobacteriota bacterium]
MNWSMFFEIISHPVDAVFIGDGELFFIYLVVQGIASLIAYLLHRQRGDAYGNLVVHYSLGLLFGHLFYLLSVAMVLASTSFMP